MNESELEKKNKEMAMRTMSICKGIDVVMEENDANGLDCIVALVGYMCSVAMQCKRSKKDLVQMISMMLDQIPADEFYQDVEEKND